ncbi:putative maleylacetoacetate isomerase [Necator americanus]|uniref:Putative maleylacetoacetate isomerase n=1 Tax=Necator americanus TaxID=51031 RepID=W2TT40_NECAM|nr:putative maleylacetoacetate isomerase [Necator americanus]ETN84948.1 putative maleylacetoacetate isomerase [Necator americanus]
MAYNGMRKKRSFPILSWRSGAPMGIRSSLDKHDILLSILDMECLVEDNNSPEFLAANPAKKVPALVVNGVPLTESMAIMEYLDEVYPDGCPLLPKDPIQRAHSRAIALQIAAGIQPVQNIRILKYVNEQTPGAGAKWANHWLTDGFKDLEAMLSRTAGIYAVGDKITIADLCIPSIIYNAKR